MTTTITLTTDELEALIAERIEAVLAADPSRFRGKRGKRGWDGLPGPMGPLGNTFVVNEHNLASKDELEALRRHVDALAAGIHGSLTGGAL